MIEQVSALSFTRQLGANEATSRVRDEFSIAPTPGNTAATTPDFSVTLASLGNEAAATLREAERISMAGLTGKADTREVVDAVMAAEQTLRTAVAIRDKIVQAYLEVSRMQI